MPSNIFIGLGSNLGDRAGNLLLAVRGVLHSGIEVIRLSRIYETEPFETFQQPAFLNMAAEVRCDSATTPEDLMRELLAVEQTLGRRREIKKGPRTIDLDLLLFENQIRNSELLQLPHPQMHRRRFVLAPLVELAPDFVHPVLNQTMSGLLEAVDDHAEVQIWVP
ncbi:MAG TPA: 2-amino-4-hydroxy-6-hydroxymethyldihydropteridine diphosphokinase [Pyrinomonadaceae bacterium]|nr:2-amino-4-hydroxy-6-hydroxymethyldihydropteridine diphosphokinase [Pyrinomonadaceae bacterium]